MAPPALGSQSAPAQRAATMSVWASPIESAPELRFEASLDEVGANAARPPAIFTEALQEKGFKLPDENAVRQTVIRPASAELPVSPEYTRTAREPLATERVTPIHVRIGRVEVRALPQASHHAIRESKPAPLGFARYEHIRRYRWPL
jgi:hypothetical protein